MGSNRLQRRFWVELLSCARTAEDICAFFFFLSRSKLGFWEFVVWVGKLATLGCFLLWVPNWDWFDCLGRTGGYLGAFGVGWKLEIKVKISQFSHVSVTILWLLDH